jgi:hypothetical protein
MRPRLRPEITRPQIGIMQVAPTRVFPTIGESVSTLMRRMALALVRATARKGEIVKPARVDRTDPRFKERSRPGEPDDHESVWGADYAGKEERTPSCWLFRFES